MEQVDTGYATIDRAVAVRNRAVAAGSLEVALVARRRVPLNGGAMDRNDAPRVPVAEHADLILAVARDRDRSAFAALYGHFAPRVKSYVRRLGASADAAEEVTQEAMVAVWRKAETFDPAQATVSTWIFTIARNKRIDLLRRERRPEVDPDDPALVPQAEERADRSVERRQDEARLKAAMSDLPPEQLELVKLAYFEDKAHSEIAEERGLPLGTVKSRLRLALARLRKGFGEEDDE